jgi:hypothetical protein
MLLQGSLPDGLGAMLVSDSELNRGDPSEVNPAFARDDMLDACEG